MILLSHFKSKCGQQNALISPRLVQSYLPNANRWKLLYEDTNEVMPPLERVAARQKQSDTHFGGTYIWPDWDMLR